LYFEFSEWIPGIPFWSNYLVNYCENCKMVEDFSTQLFRSTCPRNTIFGDYFGTPCIYIKIVYTWVRACIRHAIIAIFVLTELLLSSFSPGGKKRTMNWCKSSAGKNSRSYASQKRNFYTYNICQFIKYITFIVKKSPWNFINFLFLVYNTGRCL